MGNGLDLRGKLNLDGSGYFGVLAKAESAAHGFAHGLKHEIAGLIPGHLVPAATAGAVIEMVRHQIELASKIRDVSASVGLTTTEFQQLEYAAKQSGTSIDAIAGAIRKLAVAQQAALKGDPAALAAFAGRGLTLNDIAGKTPVQLFMSLGEHMKGAAVSGKLLAESLHLMGKGAGELIPLLVDDLQKLIDESAHTVVDPETINTLATAGDELESTWGRVQAMMAPVAAVLADIVSKTVDFVRILGDFLLGPEFRFLGTLMGGGTLNDARRAYLDLSQAGKILDERIQRERDAKKPKLPKADIQAAAAHADQVEKLSTKIEVNQVGVMGELSPAQKQRMAELQKLIDSEPDEIKRLNLTVERQKIESQIRQEAFRRLAADTQLTEMTRARAELERNIAQEKDPAKRLALEEKLAAVSEQIAKAKDTEKGPKLAPEAVDRFRKIGLFQNSAPGNFADTTRPVVQAVNECGVGIQGIQANLEIMKTILGPLKNLF